MGYLTVDGMLSGTGLRDSIGGGYISLDSLKLSRSLSEAILRWVARYGEAHFANYSDKKIVEALDLEGIELCQRITEEIPESKVEYFSSAEMKRIFPI